VFVRIRQNNVHMYLAEVRVYEQGSEVVEYESKAPTATSNRECTVLTQCKVVPEEFEATPPERTSNRVCTPSLQVRRPRSSVFSVAQCRCGSSAVSAVVAPVQ
jgi:hypothetical protein